MYINSKIRVFVIFGLLILNTPKIYAQYLAEGFTVSDSTNAWYDQQIGADQIGKVRGRLQKFEPKSTNSHPFYLKSKWVTSEIKYRGKVYNNVQALYDVYEDLFMIQHPSKVEYSSQPIALNQDQVEWFLFNNELLFKYYPITLKNSSGFFEVLYEGENVSILSKRIKLLKVSSSDMQANYITDDQYFVKVQNEYSTYRNKRSIMKYLKPYKKEIKSFIKENNLKPGLKNEQDIQQLAEFCDSILTKTASDR